MADHSIFEIDAYGKEWRHVPGFEGIYVVSEYGEVKRIIPGTGRAKANHILSPGRNRKGYVCCCLCKGGKSRTWYVHTLVCEAFHGAKPTPLHQAAHRDDDKTNNHKSNLYWATPKQNHADRRRNGRILVGERIGRSTIKEVEALEMIRLRQNGMLQSEIAGRFGVAPHTVSRIVNGKRWGHLQAAGASLAKKMGG